MDTTDNSERGQPLAVQLERPVRPDAEAPVWWKCGTHGPAKAGAWGCPECVRELRAELADEREAVRNLTAALREATEAPTFDPEGPRPARAVAQATPVAWLHTVRATGGGRPELDAALSFAPDNFPFQGCFESLSVEPLYDGALAAECATLRLRLTMAREATLRARAHHLNGHKHAGWTLAALRMALDALDGLRDDERPNAEITGRRAGGA